MVGGEDVNSAFTSWLCVRMNVIVNAVAEGASDRIGINQKKSLRSSCSCAIGSCPSSWNVAMKSGYVQTSDAEAYYSRLERRGRVRRRREGVSICPK